MIIPGNPTKENSTVSKSVLVGVTYEGKPDHSDIVHITPHAHHLRAEISPSAELTGRSLYILRFYDGALMRFDGTSWSVVTSGDADWAAAFALGHSIPSIVSPLGSDLFGAWHIPHLGVTRAGYFRNGAFVVSKTITGAVEQMAWSNPINYRGRIRWLAVSSLDNNQHGFQIDALGYLQRFSQNLSSTWSTFGGMANNRETQLSFGARIQPHNEKLHCGISTFSTDSLCDTNPVVMDHRMFFDMALGHVNGRIVPLEGMFELGQFDLAKPYASNAYDHFARTMIGQISFSGQMFYISIDGKLQWQDDYHYIHKTIYDLSHTVAVFDPGVSYTSPMLEDLGMTTGMWMSDHVLYPSVFPYDLLCRISILDGQLAPRKGLNTGYINNCALLTEAGCAIQGAGIASFGSVQHYWVESEKVRNVTKSLPVPIDGNITLPSVIDSCRAWYQAPVGTLFEVAYALAGCTNNDLNVTHPASAFMFEYMDTIWAVIATGTNTRVENRPPTVLLKFSMNMTSTSWLNQSAEPQVSGHTSRILTENGVALNVDGMVPILDKEAGVLHLLYNDPQTKQVKHLHIDLNSNAQFYRGVVYSSSRALPGGFTIDSRAALTQGCAIDYNGQEPFVFITGMTLRPDHKSVQVDYVTYSPMSWEVSVSFKHAIGTLNRGFRGEKPGFVPTTPSIQDVSHDPTFRLSASPTGVYHRFVHNLTQDGLENFNGELQYEATITYCPIP